MSKYKYKKSKVESLQPKIWSRYAAGFLYLFFIFIFVFFIESKVLADDTNQEEIEEKQEQIDELEQKAASYRQMIKVNQNKEGALQNQIQLMETQISSLESSINEIQKNIDANQQDIDGLSSQIREKQKEIDGQKVILGQLLQSFYENDQDTLTEMLLKNSSFSDFMNQTEYISQTGSRVDEMLNSIKDAQDSLAQAKKDLEFKNDEQKKQRGDATQKKLSLDSEKSSRRQLLVDTQGQEQKYQDLLERVEQEKQELLGDIEELSSERSDALAEVEANIKKPASGLASASWYFSQKDKRWANQTIGYSNTLMKSYGCAVTALSMVLKYHGVNIDPGTLADQPIFYHDLIVWPNAWKGVKLSSTTYHGNVDWDVIDDELKDDNPVIVFVKSTKRGAGHYVVIHGKDKKGEYVVHDPYWGSNIYLDSTRAYVGALYGSGTTIDQMIVYH
ncbi:MAG: C39 family peptidase [Candidatus Moranbacteria bacterium]|nr:C39 family peptidase [Candidatus Moranbacteria bacterium]